MGGFLCVCLVFVFLVFKLCSLCLFGFCVFLFVELFFVWVSRRLCCLFLLMFYPQVEP